MIAALLAATAGHAQTTLWDGESLELGSQGGCWDDGHPTVVENPSKTGINTSGKCLMFTMTNGSKIVKIPFRDWIQPNMDGSRRISLMIRKAVNDNVNIEVSDPTNGAAGYWEKVAAWYGAEGEWQKVVFDLSTNVNLNDFPGVISITAQTGAVDGEQVVYIDNVVIEPAAKVGGVRLSEVADNSLSGNVVVAGALMKGDCQNTNGDWFRVDYDDFALLASKLSASATSLDLRNVILKDAYFDSILEKCPGITIYTDGGTVTAIQSVPTASPADAPVYSISGTRVADPTRKGLYISNGRKYIVR